MRLASPCATTRGPSTDEVGGTLATTSFLSHVRRKTGWRRANDSPVLAQSQGVSQGRIVRGSPPLAPNLAEGSRSSRGGASSAYGPGASPLAYFRYVRGGGAPAIERRAGDVTPVLLQSSTRVPIQIWIGTHLGAGRAAGFCRPPALFRLNSLPGTSLEDRIVGSRPIGPNPAAYRQGPPLPIPPRPTSGLSLHSDARPSC